MTTEILAPDHDNAEAVLKEFCELDREYRFYLDRRIKKRARVLLWPDKTVTDCEGVVKRLPDGSHVWEIDGYTIVRSVQVEDHSKTKIYDEVGNIALVVEPELIWNVPVHDEWEYEIGENRIEAFRDGVMVYSDHDYVEAGEAGLDLIESRFAEWFLETMCEQEVAA